MLQYLTVPVDIIVDIVESLLECHRGCTIRIILQGSADAVQSRLLKNVVEDCTERRRGLSRIQIRRLA